MTRACACSRRPPTYSAACIKYTLRVRIWLHMYAHMTHRRTHGDICVREGWGILICIKWGGASCTRPGVRMLHIVHNVFSAGATNPSQGIFSWFYISSGCVCARPSVVRHWKIPTPTTTVAIKWCHKYMGVVAATPTSGGGGGLVNHQRCSNGSIMCFNYWTEMYTSGKRNKNENLNL